MVTIRISLGKKRINYDYFCLIKVWLSCLDFSALRTSFKEFGGHMKPYRNFHKPKLNFIWCFGVLGGTHSEAGVLSC